MPRPDLPTLISVLGILAAVAGYVGAKVLAIERLKDVTTHLIADLAGLRADLKVFTGLVQAQNERLILSLEKLDEHVREDGRSFAELRGELGEVREVLDHMADTSQKTYSELEVKVDNALLRLERGIGVVEGLARSGPR